MSSSATIDELEHKLYLPPTKTGAPARTAICLPPRTTTAPTRKLHNLRLVHHEQALVMDWRATTPQPLIVGPVKALRLVAPLADTVA
jgi:hypothetical protein